MNEFNDNIKRIKDGLERGRKTQERIDSLLKGEAVSYHRNWPGRCRTMLIYPDTLTPAQKVQLEQAEQILFALAADVKETTTSQLKGGA